MKLSIRAKDVRATEDVKSHVQRRVAFALSRFGARVLAVDVLVEEVIQRQGGRGNRCQYKIKLRRLEGHLVAEVVLQTCSLRLIWPAIVLEELSLGQLTGSAAVVIR